MRSAWLLRTWSLVGLALLGGLALAGPAAAQGGQLKVALQGDLSDVDLHMTTHYVSRVALLNVYEMLFTLGEDLGVRPMLVDKYAVSPDGLVYTLTLRKGVKFHSGKTMDSKDVVYTLKKMQAKGCRSAEFKRLMKEIEATDAQTVKITLSAPSAAFLATLANLICPAVVYPDGEAERQGGTVTKPVGTGPFEFVEWKKDSYLRVKRFRDYAADSRPASGLAGKKEALVETVDFIPIVDPSVRAAAIERGDVDIAISLSAEDVARLKGKPAVVVSSKSGGSFQDLRFGFKKGPFKDNVKLRQAVAYSLDKEEIAKAITVGLGKAAPAGIPPGTPYFTSVHAQDPYGKQNLQKAKQLLQEAGYKGEEIVFLTDSTYKNHQDTAVVASEQMKKAGFNVRLNVVDWPTAFQIRRKPEGWNLWSLGFGIEPYEGPYNVAGFFVGENEGKGAQWVPDQELNRADAALNSSLKVEDRKKAFADFQRRFFEYVPAIKVGDLGRYQATRANVVGYATGRIPRMWDVSFA
jgi:peptide/nickel transport system substrate-binding protein